MSAVPLPIQHTIDAIYDAIAKRGRSGDSVGIPMSGAGNECERALWYLLRWASPPEKVDGRRQRIFETGFIEERRLLDDLAAAGFSVNAAQERVELADGWLRGKLDGRVTGLLEAPTIEHVVECKSHNDRSFKELLKHAPPKGEGLKRSKPAHYVQCMMYMHATGLTRALYLAVNKNDDAIYTERIHYDAAFALAIEAKAVRIASTDRTPSRLHDDPTAKAAFACQWCPALALCHEKAFARRNCRTCLSASLEPGGIVNCVFHGTTLSYIEQQAGCNSHIFLPDLVPGEQIDAGHRWVKYVLSDGQEWTDGHDAT